MALPRYQPLQDTNHNMLVELLFVLNIQYTSGWTTTKTLEENLMALEIYYLIQLHATCLSDSAQHDGGHEKWTLMDKVQFQCPQSYKQRKED